MRHNLKLKISTFLALLLLTTIGTLCFFIIGEIKQDQQQKQKAYLLEQSGIANEYIEQVIQSDPTYQNNMSLRYSILKKKKSELISYLEVKTSMKVFLYLTNERAELDMDLPLTSSKVQDQKLLQYAKNNQIALLREGNSLYYAAPLNNGYDGVIAFVYEVKDDQALLQKIKLLFVQVGSIVLLISFLLAYLYFAKIANEILKLKNISELIEQGIFCSFSITNRSDELGKLSRGMYSMSKKIEENIVDMQQKQASLNLVVKKLKHLESQQKTFIGNITHEFKTPLTVILAYMDLLEMYERDPTLIHKAQENVKKEAKRLYDLVEKVLQLASFEKYDFELHQEKIDSRDILEELVERIRGKAQKFEVQITTELQPASLFLDRESFTLIFINLLDNAIKYNVSGGTVTLTSSIRDDSLMITVTDTGIGIPPDARDKIFEAFYTVSKDRSKKTGGTGLGLALVKRLVEDQQGTITIDTNKEEQGTVVEIIFPLYNDNENQT
ncbi:HAMP domain-containing histidine kinase [Shimazuella sp. AN120528]|uniref:sensor histidine kinase n=1 Tax=Shimazuella soli TaxID=1892854 RepID=UPI001F0E17F2|nr:HAMP domain-containing sensor histidine kinase [Shimazuella soli]MCH5585973.1 HAMP domain-containing histidine kinase [Shimazuella soli]